MITLFTGNPGAGKTSSMVDMLSRLPGDRPIYVDGLNGLTIPHIVCDARNWHTELPDGAILVIDEVQRVWRGRSSGSKVPESVAALETHRHRGIDVFVTTQAPRLMDANVRDLVGRHVHIRDTGVLGRYWYEWPETNEGVSWKTCVNKKRIKLPKKAFDLYKSASIHTVPVRGVPRALIFGIIALLVFFALAYGVYRIYAKTQAPPQNPVLSSTVANLPSANSASNVSNSGDGLMPVPYDPAAFFPRDSRKPETAPAFDHLRVVVAMPIVAGGVCMGERCKCYTQQGTDTGLSSDECRVWLKHRPFDPYQAPVAASSPSAVPAPVVNPAPPPSPSAEMSAGYSSTFPPVKTRFY